MSKIVWVELAPGEMRIIRIFKSYLHTRGVDLHRLVKADYRDAVGAVRHQLWLRSQGNCELCGVQITESSGHMHEKLHRGKGGEISLVNSVFICPHCHRQEHADRTPRWSKKS